MSARHEPVAAEADTSSAATPQRASTALSDAIRPPASPHPRGVLFTRRQLATVAVVLAAMTSACLAVPSLRHAPGLIAQMKPGWILAAVALELASCASFPVIFRRFFDTMPAPVARRLAWTEMGSGALLPGGGVGAFAVGGWLLHTSGMTTHRIVRRSSGLFFLTSATNLTAMLVAAALLLTGVAHGHHDFLRAGLPALTAIAAIAGALALSRITKASTMRMSWLSGLAEGLRDAERECARPTWRLFGAAGYLGFDIAALGATLAAVDHPPAAPALVLAYLIGYLANLVPVPGGIGVLEGGLTAALVIYGAPATEAAAAVLVYHVIAFWIPSLGGLVAYKLLNRSLAALDGDGATAPRGGRATGRPNRIGAARPAARSSQTFGADGPPAGIEAAPGRHAPPRRPGGGRKPQRRRLPTGEGTERRPRRSSRGRLLVRHRKGKRLRSTQRRRRRARRRRLG